MQKYRFLISSQVFTGFFYGQFPPSLKVRGAMEGRAFSCISP